MYSPSYPEPSGNFSLRGLQILVYTSNNVITTDVNFLSIPSSIHSIYKPKYTAKPPVCLKAILKLFLCRTRSLLIHLLPLNLLFLWSLPTSVNGRSTRLVFQSKSHCQFLFAYAPQAFQQPIFNSGSGTYSGTVYSLHLYCYHTHISHPHPHLDHLLTSPFPYHPFSTQYAKINSLEHNAITSLSCLSLPKAFFLIHLEYISRRPDTVRPHLYFIGLFQVLFQAGSCPIIYQLLPLPPTSSSVISTQSFPHCQISAQTQSSPSPAPTT